MLYSNINNEINKINASLSSLSTVVSVKKALSYEVSKEDFNAVCGYIEYVYSKMTEDYLQILADIVCDCYFDFGWGYRDSIALTYDNLLNLDYTHKIEDMVYSRIA